MSGTHGHVFLELCCDSDSELAAVKVEHSVAIRVTYFEKPSAGEYATCAAPSADDLQSL